MHRRFVIVTFAAVLALGACGKKKHAGIRPVYAPSRTQQSAIPATENGLASWYGHPYHGRAAANGEIYDMEKLTAAHRTLPFGTWVRVTNLSNAKSVDVRIIDRGPFIAGRIIDLSHAAAQSIELIGPGVAEVRIDLLAPPPVPESALYAVQVGAFQDRERAERYRASLESEYGTARIVLRDGKPVLWRVLVGAENSVSRAGALAKRLQQNGGAALIVRLDETATAGTR